MLSHTHPHAHTHTHTYQTGANTGIGLESARELARAGAHVVMACRSAEKCAAAEQNVRASIGMPNAQITRMHLDLSSLSSIKAFAADFLGLNLPLDILMLNAGIMKSPGAAYVGQVNLCLNVCTYQFINLPHCPSVYLSIYLSIYLFIHPSIHPFLYIYMYINIYIYIYIYLHTYRMYIYINIYVHACICIKYIYVYVNTYVYICVYIYTYGTHVICP